MRCAAVVYKRDTYRRTGRGKDGFEMHYDECRCKRQATDGKWCWQHDDTYSESKQPE
jgi:hypothetical protein